MNNPFPQFRFSHIAAAALALLLLTPAQAATRTFKVLDAITGKPVPGAVVWVTARGTFPAPGHPGEFTLGEWTLRADQNGEAQLSSIWSSRAHVSSVSAPGYGLGNSVREHAYRQLPGTDRDVLFLTPQADLALERVRYLYHLTEVAITTDPPLAAMSPMFTLVAHYAQAKRAAKGARELEALRQFCRFAPEVETRKAAGWTEIGNLPEGRAAGQELIDDCAAEPRR